MKFKTVVMTTKAEMKYIHQDLNDLDIIEPYHEDGIEIEMAETNITFVTRGEPIEFELLNDGRELYINNDWLLPISEIQGILVCPIVEE